jgi:hypothetical protein
MGLSLVIGNLNSSEISDVNILIETMMLTTLVLLYEWTTPRFIPVG